MARLALQITRLLFTTLLLANLTQAQVTNPDDLDPHYAPIESLYLKFPLLEKDYWNWGSLGSAVFL